MVEHIALHWKMEIALEHNQTDREKTIANGVIHGHEAGGEMELVTSSHGQFVRLKDYWIAEGAPDVRIYLSPDETGDVNVDGVIDLGKVVSFSGNASYEIPKDSLTRHFRSLVVYCKVYSVTFGVAVLATR